MKLTDTISVNPGKTALGHSENASDSIFRNPVLGVEKRQGVSISKVLFPSSASGSTELRKYSVPLRTLFATILIVTGLNLITMGITGTSLAYGVCTISFGAFLALGLLTRPIMAAASVFYCLGGALSIRHGITDLNTFALMFGCILFTVAGAGKYSCDTLIRQALRRHKLNEEKKRRTNMMSYKAFHNLIK